MNRAFVDLFGRSPASVAGQPVLGLFPEPERAVIERHLEVDTEVPVETSVLLADGTHAAVELIGRTIPYADEEPARATAIRDIRERRAIQERLTRQSLYDHLTGLPNRSLFVDRTTQALTRDRPGIGPRAAVLILDLDRFKGINESFGHAVGDQIIAAVGRRFEDAIRPGDTLARLGGDEYAVLVVGGGEAAAHIVATRLLEALAAPFAVEGRDTYLSVSVGIAVAESDGATAADLLREAAIALDVAKADPNASRRRLRPGDERRLARAPRAGDGPPARPRPRRAGGLLPAARGPADRARHRPRGARALAPPDARPAGPVRVHPDGRGDRPHHPARRSGPAGGVPADARVAARATRRRRRSR